MLHSQYPGKAIQLAGKAKMDGDKILGRGAFDKRLTAIQVRKARRPRIKKAISHGLCLMAGLYIGYILAKE